MKQIDKPKTFITKYTIAIVIVAFAADWISEQALLLHPVNWIPFDVAFIMRLSQPLLIVGLQWILFEKKLTKAWFIAGVIGAIIAATEGAFIMQIVQDYRYAPWLDTLQAVQYSLIFITLATFLQALVIKNKVNYSYWWILVNIIGLSLNQAVNSLFYETTIRPFTVSLSLVPSLMLMVLIELPFGITCGIFLYRLLQDIESINKES